MKNIRIIIILTVVTIAVGALLVTQQNNKPTTPNTYEKAKGIPAKVSCATNDDSIKLSKENEAGIQIAASTYLIDVPAGTNVDINIAHYSESEVSGSSIYPDKYGKYNFTANKKDNASNWEITSFEACK